jgi:CsoR family transcriptional regulator, copper-sensing transcriptional repressor
MKERSSFAPRASPSRPAVITKVKAHEGPRSPLPGGAEELHGYIKAKDKHQLQNRLRRIEGQVRGLQRMVEEEVYCVAILTQIASIVSASEKVALLLLEDHVEHCVREAVEDGEKAEEKVAELSAAVERFLRV